MMTKLLLALAAVASFALSDRAVAQEQVVVVELYTSQGCSSCPPADALFEKLAERRDIVALALHVDYWDYIGWKDSFAKPQFTARQKGYAVAAGHRTLYTPQMVVQGEDHVVGYRPMEVAELIRQHQERQQEARIVVSREGNVLTVAVEAPGGPIGPVVVQLVRFHPSRTVAIHRGENAGKTIVYANVVTEWHRLAEWDGTAPMSMTAPVEGDASLAVIVQVPNHGPILGAAAIR